MPAEIRLARAEELGAAQQLVVASINQLTERHGFGAMASIRPPDFQSFSLRDDPEGLWVAEADGDLIGFAFSWVCGDLWFLAELFVAPDQQGGGVGRQLLSRTLEHASRAGATTKALITFTFNVVSQGLYIRHGLFPRTPIYFFSLRREDFKPRPQEESLRFRPVSNSASDLTRLVGIDTNVLGVPRGKHHGYLLEDKSMQGFFVERGGECVGYAYISASGHVGPVALTRPDIISAAFTMALSIAAGTGTSSISAFLPGCNEQALSAAAEHKMRITLPMLLVASREFGDWSRYLPRNPGFM